MVRRNKPNFAALLRHPWPFQRGSTVYRWLSARLQTQWSYCSLAISHRYVLQETSLISCTSLESSNKESSIVSWVGVCFSAHDLGFSNVPFTTPSCGQHAHHFICTGIFTFNPLRAKFFRENINIYLHFMSFLHTNKTNVVEIPPWVGQGPAYST